MPHHRLDADHSAPHPSTITAEHFGVNTVTIYDQELADPDSDMLHFVDHIGAKTLRFPGGSATEYYFDMSNPNSAVSADPDAPPLLPMDDFMDAAAQINARIALVVPTRIAFETTTTDAVYNGTYGQRRDFAAEYLDTVVAFVRTAIEQADASGTSIQTVEIGNEFWASGEMTAAEYGHVAAHVALAVEALLTEIGRADIDIIAQSTSSASQVFSPREDTPFVDPKAPASAYDPNPAIVRGQGDAAEQLEDLVASINAVNGAADALDGTVLHFYQYGGFDDVDGGRDYTFFQLNRFADLLDRSNDASDLSFHISEWNTATAANAHNSGLQQAAMMVETFYEMVRNGVNAAQIWPLSFNAAQGTAMLDTQDKSLAIAGEMFRLMSQSLPGLKPVMDFESSDGLDIHGFARPERAVLFVSERDGLARDMVHLDTCDLVSGTKTFVTISSLWDGGAGGDSADAAPVIAHLAGKVLRPDNVTFTLPDWANVRIELTTVSWLDDKVTGRDGHDRIFTYGGADQISGGAGHDYIHGGKDDDAIWGSDGDDTLIGGRGRDSLTGGAGSDSFVFDVGHGIDIIHDFSFSEDLLIVKDQAISNLGAFHLTQADNGVMLEFGASDHVVLSEKTLVQADEAARRSLGSNGSDIMQGSAEADDLRGYNGADYLYDGAGRDYLRGGAGADMFVFAKDGSWDRVTDFEWGKDRLDLRAWDVTDAAELFFDVIGTDTTSGSNYINLHFADETLRLDGLTQQFVDTFSADDVLL